MPIEQQFRSAIDIFNPAPDIIAISKAQGGFRQIAVEILSVGDRVISSPEQSGSPVAMTQRPVVHDGRGHALEVLIWVQRFGADKVSKGILSAPVFSGLNGQARGPGVDLSRINVPAKFVGLAAVKT